MQRWVVVWSGSLTLWGAGAVLFLSSCVAAKSLSIHSKDVAMCALSDSLPPMKSRHLIT